MRNYDGDGFEVIDGCDLRLEDHRIVHGEWNEKMVPMDCKVSMSLSNPDILCSYIREEPLYPR